MGGPGSGRGTSASAAPSVKCKSIASFFGGGSSEPSMVDLAQSASNNAGKRQRAADSDEGEESEGDDEQAPEGTQISVP